MFSLLETQLNIDLIISWLPHLAPSQASAANLQACAVLVPLFQYSAFESSKKIIN